VKRPGSPAAIANPQCGCDGITYYNAEIAAAHGANISAPGACSDAVAKKCGDAQPCGDGAKCNFDQGTKAGQCNILNPTGTCWVLPDKCPEGAGGRARPCLTSGGLNDCYSLCSAIEREEPFYKVTNCQ